MNLNSENENLIKENMKTNLAIKIQEFTRLFRNNEEKFMKNYQELVGDKTHYDLDESETKVDLYSKTKGKQDNFLLMDEDTDSKVLRKRDEEITTLLKSINELASIYKDMQTMVVQQGILKKI